MTAAGLARILCALALVASAGSLAIGNGASAQNTAQSQQMQAAVPNLPLASEEGNNTNALNWAGYTSTGGNYTSVSGSWIVPTVTISDAANVADATWVGIGGVTSNDLIQAGTEAIPDSNGNLVYEAWMETLPQDSQVLPIKIAPGDAVSVSITEESQGVWDVSFTDATTGKSYQTTVAYDSSLSSAEWIEEMPVELGGVIGLDDFGTLDFTSGYTIKNGEADTIQESGATPLTMTNAQGVAVASPSVLGGDGSSFLVTRTNADATPLALTGDGISAVAVNSIRPSYRSYSLGGSYRSHRGGYRITVTF